jgi:integrase
MALGIRWSDTNTYLAADAIGRPIHPHTFSRYFAKLNQRLGLPAIRLHDVRHSYAVALRRAGVTTKVISRRLGHSDTLVTERVYQHVMEIDDVEAAEGTANLIARSIDSRF